MFNVSALGKTPNYTDFKLRWIDNNKLFNNDFTCKPFQKFHFKLP